MTVAYGLCSIVSGLASGWLAHSGTEVIADTRRELTSLVLQVAVLAVASAGAIGGGIVAVLIGIGVLQ